MKRINNTESLTENDTDLTGRDRIFSNVLWSWGGYFIIIVSGFIMPRMIDNYIGQFSLGIWDFCWSIASYLSLSSIGIGSSVNRYVAKYRAVGNIEGICSSVSSVLYIELFTAIVVIIISIVLSWALPLWFSSRLGKEIESSQWVVMCLGIAIAVQIALEVSRGVITGCHRWDVNNGINVLSTAIGFFLMLSALLLGNGLKALGIAYLLSVVSSEMLRVYAAFRICPELKIKISTVKWPVVKEMVQFGAKAIIATIAPFVVVQTVSLFIIDTLGASMLAVFSRPVALVRHIETFMNKFAFITTPTAGALQANADDKDLKQFFLDTTKYAAAVVFPIALFLIVFGDYILRIWMGPRYEYGLVLSILAIGYVLPVSQSPALRILIGTDSHGKIGAISLLASLTVLLLGAAILYFTKWSLISGAILLAVSLTIGNGILVPAYACYKFGISLKEYISLSFSVPVICTIALGAVFVLIRYLFFENMFVALGCGISFGAIIISILYWRFMLPEDFQNRIMQTVFKNNI